MMLLCVNPHRMTEERDHCTMLFTCELITVLHLPDISWIFAIWVEKESTKILIVKIHGNLPVLCFHVLFTLKHACFHVFSPFIAHSPQMMYYSGKLMV